MFEHDRQQWQSQTSDPKTDEAAGALMCWAMGISGVLWLVQYVYTTVLSWYHSAIGWLTDTGAYIVSFWPF